MSDPLVGEGEIANHSAMTGVLREILAQLADPRWRLPAFLLFVFIALTSAGVAIDRSGAGDGAGVLFALSGLVRLAAVWLLSVALLRIGAGSARPTYLPDGAFWLHGLLSFIPVAAAVAFQLSLPPEWPIGGAFANLATLPLAAWFVAAAVERPLAWNPAPWLREFGDWLLPVFVWSLLLVFPIIVVHALLTVAADGMPLAASWWLILVDAGVSTLGALLSLAIGLAAYRRVAKR